MVLSRHNTPVRAAAAMIAAAALSLALAASAFADAPDVKVPPNQVPNVSATVVENTGDGHAGTPADPHTVTVTVTGSWTWPTHTGNCNENRAGAGVAIDWFDPQEPGFPLGNTDASAASVNVGGTPTKIFVGVKTVANSLNAVDNVVHPTENDTGSGTVNDVTSPSSFASWAGGCGVFSQDTLLNGTLSAGSFSHGNFGRLAAGDTDSGGHAFGAPVPPAGAGQQGALLSHTYRSKADITKICAVTYDVHKGTAPSAANGVGTPGSAKEITAGGSGRNDDNGVEKNGSTPLGNACPAIHFPTVTTDVSAQNVHPNDTFNDTAHISGLGSNPGGHIDFKLYSDANCNTQVGSTSTVNVTANGDYDSADFSQAAFGSYHFRAFYSGDGTNQPAATACSDSREQVTVTSASMTLTKYEKTTGANFVPSHLSTPPLNAHAGDVVQYEITVTNTGPAAITSLVLTDSDAGCNGTLTGPSGDTADAGNLNVGETWVYHCSHTLTQAELDGMSNFTNIASATGDDPFGDPVTADDNAVTHVLRPGIGVDKKERVGGSGAFVDGPVTAIVGQTLEYQITVTNSGNAPLALAFSDPLCDTQPSGPSSGDANGNGKLDVGEAWTYNCSHLLKATDAGTFTNTVNVCGADVLNGSACAHDSVVANAGQQQVLGQQIVRGDAKLAGLTGCVARKFTVRVTGKQIQKVVIKVDGKRKVTLTKPNSGRAFAYRVDPRKYRTGSHLLTAITTFRADSQTKPKTQKLRFARCVKKRAPAFTG